MANVTENLQLELDFLGHVKTEQALKANFEAIDTALTPFDNIADASDATDVVTKFNAFLADMKAKGRMVAD